MHASDSENQVTDTTAATSSSVVARCAALQTEGVQHSGWTSTCNNFWKPCLQVSAFGDDTGTDTGDVWTVHAYHAKDKVWSRDADIELKCAAEQPSRQSGQSVTVVLHCRPPCSSVFPLSFAHDLHSEPSSGMKTRGCCWRRGRESMAAQSLGSRKCAARRSRWVSCLPLINGSGACGVLLPAVKQHVW